MQAHTIIFKALSDPTRLAIFEHLARGEEPVQKLTLRFKVSQPAISQHLGVLKRSGLVAMRRDGRSAYYRVEPKGFKPMFDWLTHYQAFWPQKIDRLQALLNRMDS